MQQKNKREELAKILGTTGLITMHLGCLVMLMFGCTDAPTPTRDEIATYGFAGIPGGLLLVAIAAAIIAKKK